jgi:hypothetical protein
MFGKILGGIKSTIGGIGSTIKPYIDLVRTSLGYGINKARYASGKLAVGAYNLPGRILNGINNRLNNLVNPNFDGPFDTQKISDEDSALGRLRRAGYKMVETEDGGIKSYSNPTKLSIDNTTQGPSNTGGGKSLLDIIRRNAASKIVDDGDYQGPMPAPKVKSQNGNDVNDLGKSLFANIVNIVAASVNVVGSSSSDSKSVDSGSTNETIGRGNPFKVSSADLTELQKYGVDPYMTNSQLRQLIYSIEPNKKGIEG